MYLSTAVLVAAICGLTVCTTPLPSANESFTQGPGAVVKRQSVDRVCRGKAGSSLSIMKPGKTVHRC